MGFQQDYEVDNQEVQDMSEGKDEFISKTLANSGLTDDQKREVLIKTYMERLSLPRGLATKMLLRDLQRREVLEVSRR